MVVVTWGEGAQLLGLRWLGGTCEVANPCVKKRENIPSQGMLSVHKRRPLVKSLFGAIAAISRALDVKLATVCGG